MTRRASETSLDPYKDILGVDFAPRRLDDNLNAFADILQAIRRLRELDLTEVHPVVVFDPVGGHDDEAER